MIAKKNKILILLDGSEDSEKSLDFIINSKIVKFDQIVLFFILNLPVLDLTLFLSFARTANSSSDNLLLPKAPFAIASLRRVL